MSKKLCLSDEICSLDRSDARIESSLSYKLLRSNNSNLIMYASTLEVWVSKAACCSHMGNSRSASRSSLGIPVGNQSCCVHFDSRVFLGNWWLCDISFTRAKYKDFFLPQVITNPGRPYTTSCSSANLARPPSRSPFHPVPNLGLRCRNSCKSQKRYRISAKRVLSNTWYALHQMTRLVEEYQDCKWSPWECCAYRQLEHPQGPHFDS